MTFSDVEKAFDRVSHEGLPHCLKRVGAPPKMHRVIASFYTNPKVRAREGKHVPPRT